MEVLQIFVNDIHYDHKIWENELNFYKRELKIFETRLEDMVRRDMPREMFRELEHFQNQFIRQKEVNDQFKNTIHRYEDAIKQLDSDSNLDTDSRHVEVHKGLEEDIRHNRKLYFELREEFNQYLEKWM